MIFNWIFFSRLHPMKPYASKILRFITDKSLKHFHIYNNSVTKIVISFFEDTFVLVSSSDSVGNKTIKSMKFEGCVKIVIMNLLRIVPRENKLQPIKENG